MRQPVGRALWRVSCPYRGPFRFGLRAGPMGLWWLDGQEFSKLFEMEEIVDAGGFRPTQVPARPAAAAVIDHLNLASLAQDLVVMAIREPEPSCAQLVELFSNSADQSTNRGI